VGFGALGSAVVPEAAVRSLLEAGGPSWAERI
jgi:hypothetical protein